MGQRLDLVPSVQHLRASWEPGRVPRTVKLGPPKTVVKSLKVQLIIGKFDSLGRRLTGGSQPAPLSAPCPPLGAGSAAGAGFAAVSAPGLPRGPDAVAGGRVAALLVQPSRDVIGVDGQGQEAAGCSRGRWYGHPGLEHGWSLRRVSRL